MFVEAFYRYKYGDRYFYEGSPSYNPGAFTPGGYLGKVIKLISVVVLNYQVDTPLATEAEGIKYYWGTGFLKVSPYL